MDNEEQLKKYEEERDQEAGEIPDDFYNEDDEEEYEDI